VVLILKLLVLTDLHGDDHILHMINSKIFNKADALIVCGDLTHYGDLNTAKQMINDLTKLGVLVLFVPGNCDPKELVTVSSIDGAINLHGKCKRLESIDFIGIGGCPPGPFNTPFELSEKKIAEIIEKAYSNTTSTNPIIVVSHSPPANTQVDLTSFGIHVGSHALRKFIEITKPVLVLCGHIHEAQGIDAIGTVSIVNPGAAHLGFYAMVDIDQSNGKIQVNLQRF
jgi:Icc-related predicted phosphoesterase